MTACPPPDELNQFLDERLGDDRHHALEQHVSSCHDCQKLLERLTAVPLPATSKSATPAPAFLRQLRDSPPGPCRPNVPPSAWPMVPGYEVLRELGRGGMGVVYLARQKALDRLVALKVLHAGALDRDRERFRAEAEAVARLRHPHIVQIHDVGECASGPYLALEYLEGGSLAERLHGDPQPLLPAARLIETLARAIHHAHEHGILHRDLKPANILLAGNALPGEPGDVLAGTLPRITDFGLAKRLEADAGPGHTHTGEIVGTPSYMAPEQARANGRALGPAVDVYALGAVLYELLTGRPPFKGATAVDTLVQLLHEEPVRPRQLRPGLPVDLETICLKCLHKEPDRRYGSALALAEDLACFRRDRPITARPIGACERALKWARRRPLPAGLLAGLVLVTVLGFAGVSWQWRKATVARDASFLEKQQAEEARIEAARQRRQARAALYYSQIAQSQLSWRVNDFPAAHRALLACLPTPGKEDRRGWEWFYLHGLYQSELFTFRHRRSGAGGAVGYSPSGHLLASVVASPSAQGSRDGELRVWDASTGQSLLTLSVPAALHRLAFSPDSRRIALAGTDGGVVVRDALTGRTLLRRAAHAQVVACMAYSPDGQFLATGSWDRTLKVCNAATGQVLHTFARHTDRIQDLAFHPSGQQLASASWDGTIRLWNLQTGQPDRTLTGHLARVLSVAYSPDGRLLASAGQNGNVKIWDVASGRVVQSVTGLAGAVLNVAFSPDGRYLAYGGSDQTVRVWDVESGVERVIYRGHSAPVECVDFSRDGQRLASCSPNDGTVMVWDLTRHPEHAVFARAGADVEALVFHGDGRRLLSVTTQGRLETWDGATGVLLQECVIPLNQRLLSPGVATAFAPGGDRLAGRCQEDSGQVRVWDTSTGRDALTLDPHPDEIVGIAFSPEGRHLATAHAAETDARITHEIRVLDARTGRRLTSRRGQGRITRLTFRPDGRWLAWSSSEGHVALLDWARGEPGPALPRHGGAVLALAFSPDGRLLASAGVEDGILRVARLAPAGAPSLAAEPLYEVPAPRLLCELAFSPDGRRLAGISRDRVQVWDTESGLEVLTLRGAPQRYWDAAFNPRLVFSPDGRQLAGTNWDESFSVWEAVPESDPEQVEARRQKRREAADARAVFWHLQEAKVCLQHRNLQAARFHLSRLGETPLSEPLQRRKEELLRRLASLPSQALRR